jgi:hypothetical protein
MKAGDLVHHKYGGPTYRVLGFSANGHHAFVRSTGRPYHDRRMATTDLVVVTAQTTQITTTPAARSES